MWLDEDDEDDGAIAEAIGLEANSDDSWNGEKLDKPTRLERAEAGEGELDDGLAEAVEMESLSVFM